MNLEEMRKEVDNLVDDPSYSPDQIDRYINEAIGYAAGLVRLPSLKRVGAVSLTDDDYYVSLNSLTDEIIGMITYVVLSNGQEPDILNGVEELMMRYPKLESVGTPKAVALEHKTLWYHPMGDFSATLVYYTRPALLLKDDDIPSEFPSHLHRKLFVNGAAWMMFDQIEDGIEDNKKVNTQSQFFHSFSDLNKDSGLVRLREWVGTNKVHHISSIWRY
jgi:hypothetical protein